MSFSLDGGTGGGGTNFWNYTNKNKDNYSVQLIGWVVELDLVCATKFGSRTIDRFDDGNPKRDLRLIIKTDNDEELAFQFAPGGRDKSAQGGEDKRSTAMKALANGIRASIPNAKDVDEILGMRVRITTEEPPGNFEWSRNNPRPWKFEFDPKNTVEHRGFIVKPDWEREGGDNDARPVEPAQKGDGSKEPSAEFLANQAKAAEAVKKMNEQQAADYVNELPPTSVYDEDIPF